MLRVRKCYGLEKAPAVGEGMDGAVCGVLQVCGLLGQPVQLTPPHSQVHLCPLTQPDLCCHSPCTVNESV